MLLATTTDPFGFETIKFFTETLTFAGGAALLFLKMGRMTGRFEAIGTQQAKEITELKKGMEGMANILIRLTEQQGRMDRIEDRQLASGKRLDELTARFNRLSDIRGLGGDAG